MSVRLNVVKATVTPQVKNVKQAFRQEKRLLNNYSSVEMRKLRDIGGVDPKASDEDGYMAKHTLGGMGAGAAAGAAVGSVVPVVGTLFGGLVGGLVGAVGGATVGIVKDIKSKK